MQIFMEDSQAIIACTSHGTIQSLTFLFKFLGTTQPSNMSNVAA